MALRYRFDRFELSPDERTLYADGQPAPLGSRALEVLLALVHRHGTLVSKEDLLDLVWPGLVVEENNLQVHISTLRKLLGFHAIATVPGRGYRFALPVITTGALVPGGSISDGLSGDAESTLAGAMPSGGGRRPFLPVVTGAVWGREGDLNALDDQEPRALTSILGSGGVGKTTLALQIAHAWQGRFKDGAVWVPLAQISDPCLVVTAVAQALCLPLGDRDPLSALMSALRPMDLLLVLDNAEHQQQAVTEMVRAVMDQAPGVRLLVTSQSPLKLQGEREFRLRGLSIPGEDEALERVQAHGAIAMFVDEVRAADRRFALTGDNMASVIELCRRLDGLPLALKLAAARVPLLGLQGTIARLNERFRLLGASRHASLPVRQQTLLSTLDWSHDLLDPAEQLVFRRLSVFAGGFSLNMAAAVARDEALDEWAVIDVLGMLVDRSLVSVDMADPPRYHLPESAREYAAMKLQDAQESPDVWGRHARAMAVLMESCYEDYWTTPDAPWLATYGCEIDNVRLALSWASAHDGDLAVQLLGASSLLYLLLGLAPECRRQAQALEPLLHAGLATPILGRYWVERSRLYWGVDNALMREFAHRAADMLRESGDARGLYLALRCLAGSGALPDGQGQAVLDAMGAIEQSHWPTRLRLQRLLARVAVLRAEGECEQAQDVCRVLLARAQAAGLEAVVSAALSFLAGVQLSQGQTEQGLATCQQLLSRGCVRRDNFVVHALGMSASAWLTLGDVDQARRCLTDFARASRLRDWEWFGLYQDVLARLATAEGHPDVAARLTAGGEGLDPPAMCALALGVQVD